MVCVGRSVDVTGELPSSQCRAHDELCRRLSKVHKSPRANSFLWSWSSASSLPSVSPTTTTGSFLLPRSSALPSASLLLTS